MAKETAKKNWRKNQVRMRVFFMIMAAVNLLYVLAILHRNGSLPSFRDLGAISFWAGQEYLAYLLLSKVAQPTISPEGHLLDCIDASNPQELGYYTLAQDVLWVCWVVQALCIMHPAFIVFYLPVPATLLYKVWASVLKPLVSAYFGGSGAGTDAGAGAEDENSNGSPRNRQERRKEELRQRKAARRGKAATD